MSGPIFERNLAALKLRSPHQAEQVLHFAPTGNTSLCLAKNDEPNILFGGMPVHSMEDPFGESAEILASTVPSDLRTYQSVFFIMGLGLGYLLRHAFNSTAARIVLYEPIIDVLHHTMTVVDFAEVLGSPRVTIVNDPNHIGRAFEECIMEVSDFRVMLLPNYQTIVPEPISQGIDAFKRVAERKQKMAETIDAFHTLFYNKVSHPTTRKAPRFFGIEVWKMPTDLWMYQEIIVETQPDIIIETGTALGGSGLYLASLCDQVGTGIVVSIDVVAPPDRPSHPRLKYLMGSSTSQLIVDQVQSIIAENNCQRVMAILDSDHSAKHVAEELAIYSQLVSVGCYLIVEDSNVNGHPVKADFGPGPMEAIDAFLGTTNQYMINASCERFLISQNPNGYLLRIG